MRTVRKSSGKRAWKESKAMAKGGSDGIRTKTRGTPEDKGHQRNNEGRGGEGRGR